MSELKLYGYFRSSAAYRVRIALNYKQLAYQQLAVNLLASEQVQPEFLALNAQGLVPVLQHGDTLITQSLSICEYLDEAYPDTRPLLPTAPALRARVRSMALLIACDIHPLNNLRVLNYLKHELAVAEATRQAWAVHWIAQGFNALERMLPPQGEVCIPSAGFTLADCCLLPQVFNARRFNVPLTDYPNIQRIAAALEQRAEVARAHPEQQSDSL